jgi:hypothetical protein
LPTGHKVKKKRSPRGAGTPQPTRVLVDRHQELVVPCRRCLRKQKHRRASVCRLATLSQSRLYQLGAAVIDAYQERSGQLPPFLPKEEQRKFKDDSRERERPWRLLKEAPCPQDRWVAEQRDLENKKFRVALGFSPEPQSPHDAEADLLNYVQAGTGKNCYTAVAALLRAMLRAAVRDDLASRKHVLSFETLAFRKRHARTRVTGP